MRPGQQALRDLARLRARSLEGQGDPCKCTEMHTSTLGGGHWPVPKCAQSLEKQS